MADFLDNVKDQVRDEHSDQESDSSGRSRGGKMDRLIENAEANDNDDEEQEGDETEIEDLTQQDSDEYGDPSTIELNETSDPQAGKHLDDETAADSDTDNSDDDVVEIHEDGTVGEPGEEEENGSSGNDDAIDVLHDLREQNNEIIELLRGIKRNMD